MPRRSQVKRRILLLDDEESVLEVMSEFLRSPHLDIVTVREIEAAEAVLEHSRFDIVVTDLRVSELGGLEGIRLIRFVKTHFPDTLVLAMSGYVTEEVHALGREAGVDAVLEKPLDLPRLRDFVLGDLASHEDGDEGPVSQVQLLHDYVKADLVYSAYQPIVDLSVRDRIKVFAYEALARGPGHTPLQNPEILFAYATRKEFLLDTDLMCIGAAAREAELLSGVNMFINIHPRSLTASDSPDRLHTLVTGCGVDPRRVVIELTEHHAIVNPEAFEQSLGALRERGFRFALDDFGVGYANVLLLAKIRPDFIKLSGEFGIECHLDPMRQKLIRSMANMAHDLGTPVIAEGIESLQDLEVVRDLGVDLGQGYYFARPGRATDMAARFPGGFSVT